MLTPQRSMSRGCGGSRVGVIRTTIPRSFRSFAKLFLHGRKTAFQVSNLNLKFQIVCALPRCGYFVLWPACLRAFTPFASQSPPEFHATTQTDLAGTREHKHPPAR